MLPRQFVKRLKIHEQTQRAWLRLFFVIFLVVPTGMTMVGLLATRTPWFHRWRIARWEQSLTQQTGLAASVGSLEEKSPNHVSLHDVRFRHPETQEDIAAIGTIEAQQANHRWGVTLSDVQLAEEQIGYAWRTIHDWYICRPRSSGAKVLLRIDRLFIHGASPLPSLVDIQCDIEPTEEKFMATLHYHHAHDPPDAWIKADFQRFHTESLPYTLVQLDTTNLQLPLVLFHQTLSNLKLAGRQATFQGKLGWSHYADGRWNFRQQEGEIRSVRLDGLTEAMSLQLTGLADFSLREFVIEDGVLQRVGGEWRSQGGGYIGREVLKSACYPRVLEARGFESILSRLPARVAYESIGISFQLDAHGLRLGGLLQPLEKSLHVDRAMVIGPESTLLFEPQVKAIPIPNVMAFFRPQASGDANPVDGPFAKWLAARLPWPEPNMPGSPAPRVTLR